jgi:hypothetical protein
MISWIVIPFLFHFLLVHVIKVLTPEDQLSSNLSNFCFCSVIFFQFILFLHKSLSEVLNHTILPSICPIFVSSSRSGVESLKVAQAGDIRDRSACPDTCPCGSAECREIFTCEVVLVPLLPLTLTVVYPQGLQRSQITPSQRGGSQWVTSSVRTGGSR